MTTEQREKLVYLTGKLDGIAYAAESNIAIALDEIRADIEELLKQDGKNES